jgi:hypothetical protein
MLAARRRSLALLLGAALFAAAACSDSTAPDSVLTAAETNELALQMGMQLSSGFTAAAASAASSAASRASLNAIPVPFSVAINVRVPCPEGGTTQLTATASAVVDEATQSVTADVTGTHRPSDCGLDVHGTTFRITGELTTRAHVVVKDGLPVGEQTASLDGSFSWRAEDGRSGTCTINYSASANYTTNVATVNGNFCGSTIQVTGPLTTS